MPSGTRIPVVSIVGKSDSGKTTLLEGLIRDLVGRGWRVAVVKHHVHEIDIDVPGKDSWRHAHAGAPVTMVSSPRQFAVLRQVEEERTLEQILEAAGDVDLLLTEGFKRAGDVKIEVSRLGRSSEPICETAERFALVTDNADIDAGDAPRFGLDDVGPLADLIERTFLAAGGVE